MITANPNTQSIMDDIENGTAFEDNISGVLDSVLDEWSAIGADSDNIFGTFSEHSIKGIFKTVADSSPMDLTDLGGIEGSIDALVGQPKGILNSFSGHVKNKFTTITDDLTTYTTTQSIENALKGATFEDGGSGGDTGGGDAGGAGGACGSLTKHFGSIMEVGNKISGMVDLAKNTVTEFKQLKTQIQSEIDSLDDNIVGLLTGQVNNTILSRVVKGTGLHDQLDNILNEAGLATNDISRIKNEASQLLTPNLNNFFNKKSKISEEIGAIAGEKGNILNQVAGELAVFDQALTTMKKFGLANALQSLFSFNECAQALLGAVGSSGFIGKLKI